MVNITSVYHPDYRIKYAGIDGIYKIIKYYRNYDYIKREVKKNDKLTDEKLINNICRAKSKIIEYGLCNPWEYFVTCTLDKRKQDRYDLREYRKDLAQFMRDERKKYNMPFKYLLIPEKHKDGAWHVHGLLYGISDECFSEFVRGRHPDKLIKAGYFNFDDYYNRFGQVSVGRIYNRIGACYYITKYITKDLGKAVSDKNAHMFYASQGLFGFKTIGEYYGFENEIEKFIQYRNKFCGIGYRYSESELFFDEYSNLEVSVLQSGVVELNDDRSDRERGIEEWTEQLKIV